jgi:hypothetical protein
VPEVEAPHRIHVTAAGEDWQVASRIAIDATLEIKDAAPEAPRSTAATR